MKRKKYINGRMKQMCVYHILAIVACVARHWNVIEYANVLKSIFAHHNIFLDFKLINFKSFTLRYYIFIIASKSYLFWNNKKKYFPTKGALCYGIVLQNKVQACNTHSKLAPNFTLYVSTSGYTTNIYTHTSKHIYQTTHTFK